MVPFEAGRLVPSDAEANHRIVPGSVELMGTLVRCVYTGDLALYDHGQTMPSILNAQRALPLLLGHSPALGAPSSVEPGPSAPFMVVLDEFGYYASDAWSNLANASRSMSEDERRRRLQEAIDTERAVLRDTIEQVVAPARARARL